jgi:SAM-dependent methyltransferase
MCGQLGKLELIVVSCVEHYRRLARDKVRAEDLVLEIGCSTGQTTRALAQSGARVLAVDCSREILDKARGHLAGRGNVELVRIDGRDLGSLKRLAPDPDVIFLDIGGTALVDNVAGLLRQCLRTFSPRLIVVRNYELAELASLISDVHPPDQPRLRQPASNGREQASEALLDLSRSNVTSNRLFAARQLRRLDAPAVRERLAQRAADPSPTVRRAASDQSRE